MDAQVCMDALVAQHGALRAELLHNFSSTNQLFGLAVTATAAFLGFAMKKEKPDWRLYLLPFAILIPLMMLTLAQLESTIRIATYIQVFLEQGNRPISWETDLLQFRGERSFADWIFTGSIASAYMVLGVVCAGLAWKRAADPPADHPRRRRLGIVVLVAFLLIPGFMMSNRLTHDRIEAYSAQWQDIRKAQQPAVLPCE